MNRRILRCLLLAAALSPVSKVSAQEPGAVLLSPWAELKWRNEYHAARKEAHEKNLPLILDFGTTNCFWCKKLDDTTFRDPRIVALMNDRFVPLKIDAEREFRLANDLRIESYPTLIVATSDGKILSYMKGYKDAEELHEILQRLLANVQAPEWMHRDLQLAAQKMQAGEYPVAIATLRGILDDPKGRPLQPHAKKFLDAIEMKAMERVGQARDLYEKGQTQDAMTYLSDTVKYFPNLEATRHASDLLVRLGDIANAEKSNTVRTQKARDLLAQAREFYKQRDLVPCLERCSVLQKDFNDLPEGQDAMLLMAEFKSNPVVLQQAADLLSERLGEMYAALAESHLQKGQNQRAEFYYQRVVLACPGTRQAEQAQVRLTQLQSVRPGGPGLGKSE